MDSQTTDAPVCGTDGCDDGTATAASLRSEAGVGTRIDIVSDAICPWCFIGKRQLERALAMLESEGLRFSVHWNPFQLNPDMPREGRERAAYRAWKFGGAEQAKAADDRVAEAAERVGLRFRQDLMLRTPNTLDAHRLIWFAGQKGVQDATMEAVFAAYFLQGRDIGDRGVLADCAGQAGLDQEEAAQFLAGDAGGAGDAGRGPGGTGSGAQRRAVVLPGRLRAAIRRRAGGADGRGAAPGQRNSAGTRGGVISELPRAGHQACVPSWPVPGRTMQTRRAGVPTAISPRVMAGLRRP